MALFSIGCSSPTPAPLLVAAASDMAEASAQLPTANVRFTFGSSGLLARQIASGAPYDVFLSADERRVRELAAGGHVHTESIILYATGRLALWSKSGTYRRLDDLLRASHVAIANPAHAPYGMAARQALERTGLWTKLEGRIVYGESVRQALEFARSGNADAALVALSLVAGRGGGVVIDSAMHDPIRQAGAVVSRSGKSAAGRDFLRFLASPAGQKILAANGFETSVRQ